MIDVVAVLRAEDAALDFLSVLGGEEHEVHVLCGDTGEHLVLPAGRPLADRLDALAPLVRPVDEHAASPGTEALAALVEASDGGGAARLWTHSPADTRRSRGRLGRDAADAAGGRPVLHAVGHSPYLQFISDLDRPLDRAGIAAKLAFANRHCAHLLSTASEEHVVRTGRVHATERFFAAGPEERERLFALLASLDEDAATVDDPWEFATSAYEAERLDTTVAWIAGHCPPGSGPLVEVGACEGALTARLVEKGFTVHAAEPNAAFRRRLTARAGETAHIHPESLEELAARPGLPGAAYLLIEMLYYGQDLDLLDRLPADLVFVALEPEALAAGLTPWLERTPRWEKADETPLVAPALETVCGGRAYLGKRGSIGVLLRRTGA
ncbi:nodulation S family protein [Streptomyces sp. DH8]|uniref:nodulation S family protein n=1 Tax=Streptomyces sp. DH8 TaxID=2857008 RepID=UPI001E5E72A0|nr:nodulation S family protein [Streptomyces sp. DH8]